MQDFLTDLNETQREAVINYKGPSLVIAGAGSGKTRVLTYRIAYLIEKGVSPFTILALTFTNKAANEMKKRIGELVGFEMASSIWMGTFHSIFSKILRFEAQNLGFEPNFSIYDTSDSRSLIKSIIKELKLDDKTYKPADVHGRISNAKNNLITAEAYHGNHQIRQQDSNHQKPMIADIYKRYSARCRKANAMDFDDLLLYTNILFRDHPEILKKYSEKFNYLLVDEYQDTNYSQYLIVKKLASDKQNLCVVGDDAQSIYSFRGAKIENILNFKNDYPGYRLFKLEQNYRSTRIIVDAANSIIRKNKGQIQKTVFSENETGEKIGLIKANTDIEEGYQVIGDLHDKVLSQQLYYSDFAILYRTNAQSRIFEEALRKRNIPYKIYGGLSFYDRKEIKDLLAYFRLTCNKNDDEAIKRVINYPTRGIGNTTLQKMEGLANQENLSIWDTFKHPMLASLVNKGTLNKIGQFKTLVEDFTHKLPETDAYDLAYYISSATGILKELHNDTAPESVSRSENIQELLNSIREFCEATAKENEIVSLERYMENVSLITDMDTEKEEDKNKVTLMTVHSAKGLEFKHVYVVGMEEELFPSAMSFANKQDIEEERRLFYVAITRAEKQATVSFADSRYRWGKPMNLKVSRFLKELDPKYLSGTLEYAFEDHEAGFENALGSKKEFPFAQKKKTFQSGVSNNKETGNNFKKLDKKTQFMKKNMDNREKIPNFTPDKPSSIQSGMFVYHQQFGKGKVLNLEGEMPNTKATVFFQNAGQKQILLKFAKLKIVDN